MEIWDGELRLRLMREEDLSLLLRWLADPRVLRWYEGRDTVWTAETLHAHYDEPFEDEGFRCILEREERPVGYLQFYRLTEEMLREYETGPEPGPVWALDLFLGMPELWGRGLGPRFIRMVCGWLERERQAARVLLDPHTDNARAIRAYEKAGFSRRRLLKEHELFEGERVDCWLMEYLCERPHRTTEKETRRTDR